LPGLTFNSLRGLIRWLTRDGSRLDPFAGGDGSRLDPFAGGDGSRLDPFAGGDGTRFDPFAGGDQSRLEPFAAGGRLRPTRWACADLAGRNRLAGLRVRRGGHSRFVRLGMERVVPHVLAFAHKRCGLPALRFGQ
jgi:hypothetical protein